MSDITDRLCTGPHGVLESNPITDEIRATREAIDYTKRIHLSDPSLTKITRLRLVTDPGFPMYDLSYCYGELADGTPVSVILPEGQFSKRNLKGDLIEMARREKRFAKGLGLLDPDVISICS